MLEAARQEFSARGFVETQSGDIAASAGVSVGTFYEYFEDKRDAYILVAEEMFEAIVETEIADYLAKEPVTTRWYRLIDLFRVYAEQLGAYGRLWPDLCATATNDEKIAERVGSFETRIIAQLTTIVSAGIPVDSADRAEVAAHLTWSMIDAALRRSQNHDKLAAESAFAIDQYLTALGR